MLEYQYLLGLSFNHLDPAERDHARDGLRKGILRLDGRGLLSRGVHR